MDTLRIRGKNMSAIGYHINLTLHMGTVTVAFSTHCSTLLF